VPLWVVIAGVLGLAWLLFQIFRPMLAPVIWAMIIAHLFWPVHRRLLHRLSGRPNLEAVLITIVAVCVLILPVLALTTVVVNDAMDTYQSLESDIKEGRATWLTKVQSHPVVLWLLKGLQRQQPAPKKNLEGVLQDNAKEAGVFIATQASRVVGNALSFLLDLGICIFTIFFAFRNGRSWLDRARHLVPIRHEAQKIFLAQIDQTIKAVLYGSAVVAVLQGILGGIGFWIVGLPSVVLWATVMAFLSLIPFLGSFLVWIPAAAVLVVQGKLYYGIFLTVWGLVVIGLSDNLLRPFVIGTGGTRLSTFMIFISLLGGVQAFGTLGFILGPIVAVVAIVILDLYERSVKVLKPEVTT
jgi:predicted PurR-regulated permease PerM